MNLLAIGLGISLVLFLFLAFTLFVSAGPFLALLVLVVVLVVFAIVFFIITFCVYKVRNFFKEDSIYDYDFDDFIYEVLEDISTWCRNKEQKKESDKNE